MSSRKRGLGRGLDALLGDAAEGGPARAEDALRNLPVEQIRRSRYQPRQNIDSEALSELADSIRAQGVVQPVVVRPVPDDTDGEPDDGAAYELIAGERRWRAAQLAGVHEIPAVVRTVPEQAAVAMALIENIQREDLNPLEEARALQRLKDEFELTHEEVAESVGRSRTAVTNLMRMTELNDEVKALVDGGELEMGHARSLLSLKGSAQTEAARRVAAKRLSVRETESLVKRWPESSGSPRKSPDSSGQNPDVVRLQDELGERLGAAVTIKDRGGKGRVVIQYHSLDELDGILSRMR